MEPFLLQRSAGGVPPLSPSMTGAGAGQSFLSISVTDPVKLGSGVQAYISYRVSTKTNMQEYRGPEKIVIRRFSDFVWLHERLAERNKGIVIPPLPEKSAVEKFRFSAEFIEVRRRALDVFMNRIATHPQLHMSEDLKNFLQADEEAMERARSAEGSVFKKKPSDFMQMFKDVQMKVSDAVLGKDKPVEETDPEYEKLKHYVVDLEDHLAEAQRQSMKLVKRQRELGQVLSDFGKSVKLLGNCEGGSLGKAFADLGGCADQLSFKLQNKGLDLLLIFEEPLKEYVRTVQAIKVVMADRAQAYRQHRELTESSKLKELNLEKLKLLRPDKAGEVEAEVTEIKAQSDEAKLRYEEIVRLMEKEMVQFQEAKTRDLGLVLHDFACAQAQLASDTADAWRTLLPYLDNPHLGESTVTESG
ncbi:unnamed protein product [Sphagnum jensenii]|uniref:PX domain-containing protein n=1 Tax=Sphagnum jensenii TaxID=128206 RepID=A0ABP0WGW9_9BRYO